MIPQYSKPKIIETIRRIQDEFSRRCFDFGRVFFPHYFRKVSSSFHKIIIDAAVEERRLAVASPRESGKSVLLGFLYLVWCITFKKKHFIVYLTNTEEKSSGGLAGIKREYKENQLLMDCFGIKIEKDTDTDTVFRHPDGHLVRVLCKGLTQMGSIRGERFGAYRPDLLLVDDLEDDEMLKNPDRRRELQEMFDEAIEPAVDREWGQIIFIGTIGHDDSLIRKVTKRGMYTEYRKLFFQAKNPRTGTSLWPQKWTVEELGRMEADNPVKFAKEYQNDPVSGSRSNFKKEDFRRWEINNGVAVLYNREGSPYNSYNLRDCRAAIGCDLAWEDKRENDETVIMPALLTPNDEILVDEYVHEKGMKPDKFEDILFPMVDKYENMTGDIVEVGFEKAKHEKIMKWLLGQAMPKRKKYLILKDLKWDADKITRIVTRLQPRYANHTIFHRSGMGELEYQLMRIPSGAHDDHADALANLAVMLKYPKSKKSVPKEDSEFDYLYKKVLEKRTRRPYVFGNKAVDNFPFPHHESFR
jgi:hypothetical protein